MRVGLAKADGLDEQSGVTAQTAAVSQIRAAAGVYAATGDENPLRDGARALAADAAARGLRAEELVIAFKQIWTSIPELSPVRRQSRGIVDELVTICINEYYRRRGAVRI